MLETLQRVLIATIACSLSMKLKWHGRLVLVEVRAEVKQKRCFLKLNAPVKRVTGWEWVMSLFFHSDANVFNFNSKFCRLSIWKFYALVSIRVLDAMIETWNIPNFTIYVRGLRVEIVLFLSTNVSIKAVRPMRFQLNANGKATMLNIVSDGCKPWSSPATRKWNDRENGIYFSHTISFSNIQKMGTYCHDIGYFMSWCWYVFCIHW